METSDKPELVVLHKGESFKVLQVTGNAGMKMPLHYSTMEAVIIVQSGSAVLAMDHRKHLLHEGNSFVIPALQKHTLSLEAEFKALVVMPLDSRIEFAD